jgi:hypothetical protein
MLASQVITSTAAIMIPSATALLVAYWHRKQMRQIELFKRDPSAGLRPPASPPWRFLKSYGDLIFGIGVPSVFLVVEISTSAPISRRDVFNIAADISFILFVFTMHLLRSMLRIAGRMAEAQGRHLEISKELLGLAKDSLELTKGSLELTKDSLDGK